MVIVNSIDGRPIRLTSERWDHIARLHPELVNLKDWILDTVQNPDRVLEGDFGEVLAARFFRRAL